MGWPSETVGRMKPRLVREPAAEADIVRALPWPAVASGYSMTWSARARIAGEMVRPSSRAVFRLTMKSNLTGSWIGRSPGLAPFRHFRRAVPDRVSLHGGGASHIPAGAYAAPLLP